MRKHIILLIFLILLFSCKKEQLPVNNLNNNKITILGHGGIGIGQAYPMNTYESILKCINLGADGTEIDIQMTKNGVLVAYHSKDLSDNTNLKGKVNDYKWSEIKNGYYSDTPYLNYSILSLDQLFSNISNLHKYKFTFECKLYTNNVDTSEFQMSYINAITQIIDKYNLDDNVYIESKDKVFLERLQKKNINFKLFIYPSSFDTGFNTAIDLGLYGITISIMNISKEQIEIAHRNNLHIAVCNTHSKKRNIEAIQKNPDFIQSDRIEHLINVLK